MKLYRFVRSLRDAVQPGDDPIDVVLFLDAGDAPPGSPLEWVLKAFSVTVVPFRPAEFADERMRKFHPSSYRWILIRDWLKAQAAAAAAAGSAAPPYAAVFFTDVRDAVFQASPFAAAAARGPVTSNALDRSVAAPAKEDAASAAARSPGEVARGFYAFLEARPRTVAECGWNAGWVRDCHGDAGLAKVGSHVISCSGTSLATWDAAVVYAQEMAGVLATNPCERNGADQGVHNFIVHGGGLGEALAKAGLPDRVVVVDNEFGFVGTVQSMALLRRDRAGRLLNDAGAPYAVVHQYDRSAALEEQYARQFPWLANDGEREIRK